MKKNQKQEPLAMKQDTPSFWLSMPKINYTLRECQPVHDHKGDEYLRRIFKGYPPINYRLREINGGLQ